MESESLLIHSLQGRYLRSMSRWDISDIAAISKLATRVYVAYKNAPHGYGDIFEEVMSLQTIINSTIQHFESTTLSDNDWQLARELLESCQSVLQELNLIEECNSPASANTRHVVKPGAHDITTLKARLISNTVLLNDFIQRFNIHTITIEYIMLISLL